MFLWCVLISTFCPSSWDPGGRKGVTASATATADANEGTDEITTIGAKETAETAELKMERSRFELELEELRDEHEQVIQENYAGETQENHT